MELVGQAILTYNAQQQYFQGGPGGYFNPIYYNVSNPFCSTTNTTQSTSSTKSKENNSNSDQNIKSSENKDDKIETLELRLNQLMAEIEKMKNIYGKINY